MKIVLINEGFSDNLGDKAIKLTLERILEEEVTELKFEGYSCSREKTILIDNSNEAGIIKRKIKKILEKKNFLTRNIKKIIIIMLQRKEQKRIRNLVFANQKTDLFIIGGGQLIQSNGTFPFVFKNWVNEIKSKTDAKVIVLGVGIGKNFTSDDIGKLRESINKIDKFYLRDESSLKILQKYFQRNGEIIPDVVFGIDTNTCNSNYIDSNIVSLGIIEQRVYKKFNKPLSSYDYYNWWYDRILFYQNLNKRVKLIYTTQNDYHETLKFIKYLNEKSVRVELCKITNLTELIDVINKSEIIISGRMHALILAAVLGKKIIPYNFSPKIDTFIKENLIKEKNGEFFIPENRVKTKKQVIKNIIQEILSSYRDNY